MKKRELVTRNIKTAVLSLILLVYLVPFILVVINSFKPTKEFLENPLTLPQAFSLSNFASAFQKMNFLNGLTNTAIITVVSVLLIALFSAMAAYLMVRSNGKAVKFLFLCMVSAMIIPFQALMVPLVKIYGSLGILNNQATLIYMYLGFGAPMAVFIYHGFIKSVPLEIEEAAMIDGCSQIKTFFKIVFPLVKPISFTVIILDVLWIWNDFLLPLLLLGSNGKVQTLPLAVTSFAGSYVKQWDLILTSALLAMLPIIILFIFAQRYIIKGMVEGSIK